MSSNDLRSLEFAAGYDAAFLAISFGTWYWFIRPARRDIFRPNPKANSQLKSRILSENTTTTPQGQLSQIQISDDEDDVWNNKRCYNAFTPKHWLVKLWKWDIKNYASTDVYLYLLFQRNCMIVFTLISLVTMSVGFPIIWTAGAPMKVDSKGDVTELGFFDRAVIVNVPMNSYFRLWVLYGLVWFVFVISVTGACMHFRAVRENSLKASTSSRRWRDSSNSLTCYPASGRRFLPNQFTICVHGIDRTLKDSEVLKKALLQFYDEDEICSVNLIMDYSNAFHAHKQYNAAVNKTHKIQRKIDSLLIAGKRSWLDCSRCFGLWFWKNPNAEMMAEEHTARSRAGRRKLRSRSPTGLSDPLMIDSATGRRQDDSQQSDEESFDSYKECDSVPASPHMAHDIPQLPAPEKFQVYVGQLPYATLDSAVLSPRHSEQQHRVMRSPRELSGIEKRKLKDLQASLEKAEELARARLKDFETILIKRPKFNVGTAFVCFTSWQAARFAINNDFAHPACPVFRAHRKNLSLQSPTRSSNALATTSLLDDGSMRSGLENLGSENDDSVGGVGGGGGIEVKCKTCGKNVRNQHCRCATSFWDTKWRVREAPPPEDIVWANMSVGRLHRAYRIFIVNLSIFLLLFSLTSSTIATALLFSVASNLEKALQEQSFIKVSVTGWLAPLFLYLINALLLPFLVSWGANASRFWKRSSRDRTVLYANVHYMVLNSLVLPVLGTTSFQTLALFFTNTPWGDIPSILGRLTAGASGSFVLRYLMNTICINTSMQLMQLPMFSQQRVLLKLGKRANRWDFDYGFWYAFHLAVFSVCIVFSVDFPLVPVGGAIFFGCKFWVDKYNMTMKVWRTRSESAGAVANSAISFIFYFISLFMFLMSGYFLAVALSRSGNTTSGGGTTPEGGGDTTSILGGIHRDRQGEAQRKSLTIGAIFLLLASIILCISAAAEKAQRSLLLRHAHKVNQIMNRFKVKIARRLEQWGLSAPLRGVLDCDVNDGLSKTKIQYLKQSYIHPFECRNRLNLVLNLNQLPQEP